MNGLAGKHLTLDDQMTRIGNILTASGILSEEDSEALGNLVRTYAEVSGNGAMNILLNAGTDAERHVRIDVLMLDKLGISAYARDRVEDAMVAGFEIDGDDAWLSRNISLAIAAPALS